MRDPFLMRGPDHEYHLVGTWGWRGQSLGYAHSPDLVHWPEQREIPIMADILGRSARDLLGHGEIAMAHHLVEHCGRKTGRQSYL
jgi:hypothetical protein